ncbi:hypothetical protein BN000_01313 [Mycobacterium rhizamassiliense]|jgi:hypothetical protein|uniref:Uncharacterized protein n=1 Tax=Mycobacterium rhizamassiliense TaxID=1841860 RepID=A0A2U3NQ63_9MYCO|nr:hypothetical protein [Mycobacterium rhizamassiliense]SPM33652.1 hypothetical protein BN000_01313 [Mycobacterium rhizamassiliense]
MASGKPEDARKMTDEQREVEKQLEHQHDDPDGPGLGQSRDNTAEETSR